MSENFEAAVRHLLDRQQIHDCILRYARAMDRADRDLIKSVFHEDALDDHGMFVGDREEFADWALPMHAAAHFSHQHCLFNHLCEIDGDTAHTETYYMFACMNKAGRPFTFGGGRYIDRLERREGEWKIAVRRVVRDWTPLSEPVDTLDTRTLTTLFDIMSPQQQKLLLGAPVAARDRSDLSYQRPLELPATRLADRD